MTQSPWFEALLDPACLLLLVASVVAGLLAAWWLFPAGLLLWLFLVLRVLLDPSLRLNQTIQSRKDLAERFQTPFNRIQRIQVNIFNSINGNPKLRGSLQPIQTEVDQLVNQLYNVCQKMTPLENYRQVSSSQISLEQDLKKMTDQAASATDPVTQREYQDSAKSIQQRLQTYNDASERLNRFDAQLVSFENDLQTVLSEVIQLQTQSGESASQNKASIIERLRQEKDQLSAFS